MIKHSLWGLLLLPLLAAGGIRQDTEAYLKKYFGEPVRLSLHKLTLEPAQRKAAEKAVRQRFFKKWLYVWRITQNDSTVAYALLDNVKGKAMPITFLVIFDADGRIRNARIIKYREAIGGAVQNRSWLEKFTGLGASSAFKVGRDIDAISGATISVNAVTRGIHKLSLIFPSLKGRLDEP